MDDVRAPAADDPGPGPATGVLLRLGSCRYAVTMTDVAEVVALPPVTRVPGSPGWLTGVANWRGRMLPVLDLRPLLGTAAGPLASSARLVVVQVAGVTAGLVAEAVPGVYDVAPGALEPVPPTLPADAARLLAGALGPVEGNLGPVVLLDVPAVLALREQVDRRRHGS